MHNKIVEIMKIWVRNVMAIMLASLIMVVGAGFTIVSVCCNKCAEAHSVFPSFSDPCLDQKIFTEEEEVCCNTHIGSEEKSTHEQDDTCKISEVANKCCISERISIELDSFLFKHQLSSPFVWFNSVYASMDLVNTNPGIDDDNLVKLHKIPITTLPRTYLALIRVLII